MLTWLRNEVVREWIIIVLLFTITLGVWEIVYK